MTDTSSQTHSHFWSSVPLAFGPAALYGAALPLSKLNLQHGYNGSMTEAHSYLHWFTLVRNRPQHYPELRHPHSHG